MTNRPSRITGTSVRMDGSAPGTSNVKVLDAAAIATGVDGAGLRDPLTGLVDWHLFVDRATGALARAARNGWSTAVLVVDVDQFHHVNRQLGHGAGDLVLLEVARRLDAGFRPYDTVARPGHTVARLGADEFVILCENVRDLAVARSLGRRVAGLLEAPVRLRYDDVLVTAAVGVTLAPPGSPDVEALLVQADSAMRRAKQQGRGATVLFTEAVVEVGGVLGEAERELQRALVGGELRLCYQPKIALESDRIVGVEALLRWQHPERGLVPPCEFIPLAEQTGLIVPIGAWVIEEACRQVARWRRTFPGHQGLVVSVNVSTRQFGPGLVDVVARALSASGTEPEALCLEVTESLLLRDADDAVAILQELADLGVAVSIDDFGTGQSTLSRLRQLPVHELKIDKSFIDGLGENTDGTAIVAAIIAMAHALDLCVVAEGVETADQLQRLRTLGCEQAQGFHLARPGPPAAIDVLLRAETTLGWRSHAPQTRAPGTASETLRPNRILVVDDDANVRQLAVMSLTTVGFEVHEAIDGASALATAKLIVPDCILLDLAMPDMSGMEVCRALRADPCTAACTILILTITDDAADKVEAFSSGADDYIVKPFSPRGLVSRVHAAMRRRREAVGMEVRA